MKKLPIAFLIFLASATLLLSFKWWIEEPKGLIESRVEEHEHEEHEIVLLSKEQMTHAGIEVAFAAPSIIEDKCVVSGRVIIDPEKEAHVVSHVSGIVQTAHKNLGDHVKKGEVLAIIESKEMAEAKADYLASLRRHKLYKEVSEREGNLYKKSISSKQDFLEAKMEEDEAEIAFNLSEQRLFSLGLPITTLDDILKTPSERLREYELKSPISGTVINRHLNQGEVVEAMHEGYTVADLSTLWVELNLYPRDLSKFYIGQRVTIVDSEGREGEAILRRIDPVADMNTGRVVGIATVENYHNQWRPGSYVCVEGEGIPREVKVAVPLDSVVRFEGEDVVFVQTSEGFIPRPVQTGRSNREVVEIVAGLGKGEPYISKEAILIKFELTKGEHSHD